MYYLNAKLLSSLASQHENGARGAKVSSDAVKGHALAQPFCVVTKHAKSTTPPEKAWK